MNQEINGNQLELLVGDITKQQTEAIVNAANGSLLGGGGVDAAIHKAAGAELVKECREIREQQLGGDYLQAGEAVITKGYKLPASYVIHTVGPVWKGNNNEETLLAGCYHNALNLANEKGLKSISFPSISTGVYHFPLQLAAETAIDVIVEFLKSHQFGEVTLTLFSEEDFQVYEKALKNKLEEDRNK